MPRAATTSPAIRRQRVSSPRLLPLLRRILPEMTAAPPGTAKRVGLDAIAAGGLERRLLDRRGGEMARATSIVRYAPGSRFERHVHAGGEEILVLEGTFADEHGDYAAGTYLRNPAGSSHAPFSEEGCTLLAKLQQMHPADQLANPCSQRIETEEAAAPTAAPSADAGDVS